MTSPHPFDDRLGRLTASYNITFERRANRTPKRLSEAITDSSEVTEWMGHPARIDLVVGGDYFVDFEDDSVCLVESFEKLS